MTDFAEYKYSKTGYKNQLELLNQLINSNPTLRDVLIKKILVNVVNNNPFSISCKVSPKIEFTIGKPHIPNQEMLFNFDENKIIVFTSYSQFYKQSIETGNIAPILYAIGHEYRHFLQSNVSLKQLKHKPLLKKHLEEIKKSNLIKVPSLQSIINILEMNLDPKVYQPLNIYTMANKVEYNIYATKKYEIDAREFAPNFASRVLLNWHYNLESKNIYGHNLDEYIQKNIDIVYQIDNQQVNQVKNNLAITQSVTDFYKKITQEK